MKRHEDPLFETYREAFAQYEAPAPAGTLAAVHRKMNKVGFWYFSWTSLNVYTLSALIAAGLAFSLFANEGGESSALSFTPKAKDLSLAAMEKVITLLPRENEGRKIPVIIFTKGGGIWLNDMAQVGADVIAIDWTMSLSRARKQLLALNKPLALQGNLDPLILFSEPEQITKQASLLLEDLASAPALKPGLHPLDGHIFNLGHGISQFTPPESVSTLAKTVIEHSKALRLG